MKRLVHLLTRFWQKLKGRGDCNIADLISIDIMKSLKHYGIFGKMNIWL